MEQHDDDVKPKYGFIASTLVGFFMRLTTDYISIKMTDNLTLLLGVNMVLDLFYVYFVINLALRMFFDLQVPTSFNKIRHVCTN